MAERWFLNLPEGARFDASALLLGSDGSLLTVNDKVPGLYRINLHTNATADLVRDPIWFTPGQLAHLNSNKIDHWDLEGLSRDSEGRIYVCEELNRWIIRCDPASGQLERLLIDWKPVAHWFSKDRNASWEGIAAGTDGHLYLANERSVGRIVVVDLSTLKVIDDFQVAPLGRAARDIHYSDLSWFKGELWVLCRESRRVLRVNPATHQVLADFDYTEIELSVENGYAAFLPVGNLKVWRSTPIISGWSLTTMAPAAFWIATTPVQPFTVVRVRIDNGYSLFTDSLSSGGQGERDSIFSLQSKRIADKRR